MQITKLQNDVVEKILAHFSESDGEKIKVDLKAPTGSGKTLMATSVISRMICEHPEKKLIFIVATISSSDLPRQFERKIGEYKRDLPFSAFEVEYVESPSAAKSAKKTDAQVSLRPERNKVFIFGKSTFGKSRIFTEQGVLEDFVAECRQQGFSIFYIRDEAHIGGDKADAGTKNFEALMAKNASFVLRMTATFDKKDGSIRRVELSERDLCDETKNEGKWLVKNNPQIFSNDKISDEDIMKGAVAKFKEIQAEYAALKCKIRPAMLVQVDNESENAERQATFIETLAMAKRKLTEAGLSWVQYFGAGEKEASNVDNAGFTLEKITRADDPTDCIIFKIGPSTGWDIPRACMLVQLRNVCSKSLSVQTIGRIKRNPFPDLAKNPVTMQYFIHSNEKNAGKNFSLFEYEVKNLFKSEPMLSVHFKLDGKRKFAPDKAKIKAEVEKFLREKTDDHGANELLQTKSRFFCKKSENDGRTIWRDKKAKVEINDVFTLLKIKRQREKNLTAWQKIAFDEMKRQWTSRNSDALPSCHSEGATATEESVASLAACLPSFACAKHRDTRCFASLNMTGKKVPQHDENAARPCDAVKKLPKWESLFLILCSEYMGKINEICQAATPQNLRYEFVESPIEPFKYSEISDDGDGGNFVCDSGEKYLYNVKKDGKDCQMQLLDSEKERKVWEILSGFAQWQGDKVKIWAKNWRAGSIYGDYLDEFNRQRRSYFDFVLKFANDNYLYLEVKGDEDSDIDRRKTEMLKNAYQDYFEKVAKNNEGNLFVDERKIVIAVAKVGDAGITLVPFYNEKIIGQNLSDKNLENVIKILAE